MILRIHYAKVISVVSTFLARHGSACSGYCAALNNTLLVVYTDIWSSLESYRVIQTTPHINRVMLAHHPNCRIARFVFVTLLRTWLYPYLSQFSAWPSRALLPDRKDNHHQQIICVLSILHADNIIMKKDQYHEFVNGKQCRSLWTHLNLDDYPTHKSTGSFYRRGHIHLNFPGSRPRRRGILNGENEKNADAENIVTPPVWKYRRQECTLDSSEISKQTTRW